MAKHLLTTAYSPAITVPVGAVIQNWGVGQIHVTTDTSPTDDDNSVRIPPGQAYRSPSTSPLIVRARSTSFLGGVMGVVSGL